MKLFKTGLDPLDSLLGGGLRQGSITLIAGESGVGKTTLMFSLTYSVSQGGGRVIYIDSEANPVKLIQEYAEAIEYGGALRKYI